MLALDSISRSLFSLFLVREGGGRARHSLRETRPAAGRAAFLSAGKFPAPLLGVLPAPSRALSIQARSALSILQPS